MSELVTLELPSDLVRQARALAASTNRRFEDAVAEWIERAVAEPPIAALSDAELVSACDSVLPEAIQSELSALHLDSDLDALLVRSYWVEAGWHPPDDM